MHESTSSALAAGGASGAHGQSAVHAHGGDEHGSVAGMALKVFIALCVLTCASLLTYTRFWQENVPMEIGRAVMLVVSLTKAFLVVAFFMHLWWEAKWKYVVTFPALVVSVLLCTSLVPDIGMRTREYDAARLLNAPEAMPYSVGSEFQVSQPAPSERAGHSHAEGQSPAETHSDAAAPHSPVPADATVPASAGRDAPH